jgi:hypothetical protein
MEQIEKRSYFEIKKFCKDIEKLNVPVFYRGTKTNYLLPSLVPLKNNLDLVYLLEIEKKLLSAFKKIYPHKFDYDAITSDWLYRIRAREYGLASRLIDWANFFHIALEFATNFNQNFGEYKKHVFLWILILEDTELLFFDDLKKYFIEKLNSSYLLRGVLYGKNIDIAAHRQFVQGGNFLVQPNEYLTTKLNKQSNFLNKLICLKIPVRNIVEIRKDLAKDKKIDIESQSLLIDNFWLDSACRLLNCELLYSANDSKKLI